MKKNVRYLLVSSLVCGFLLCSLFLISCSANNSKDDLKWWQKTNAYELYVKSFKDSNNDGIGDLNGITQNLDYLQSLNVGALWLTPVYSSPMVDNGYDISNYYDIDKMYGSMSDMENLISNAKNHNIKIIMDLVMNHTSDQNEWFIKSCENKNNEYSDYYIWRDAKPDGSAPNNWRSIFGGSAWTWNAQRGQYYLHTFASQQPDLNWENEKVRKEMQNVGNFWLDKGLGGFRVDACVYFKKPAEFVDYKPDGPDGLASIAKYTTSLPGIFDYLHEFKDNVTKNKDVFVVGEGSSSDYENFNQWVGKDGVFDMLFSFGHIDIGGDWHNKKYKSLKDLKDTISNVEKYTKDNAWCPIFFENHDTSRSVNAFFPNGTDEQKASKAIGTVMYGLRGTPFLFQGQEIGMSNCEWTPNEFRDLESTTEYNKSISKGASASQALNEIKMHARDNARTVMQWNTDKYAGFSNVEPWIKVNPNYCIQSDINKSINVKTEENNENSTLNFYKKLIAYRQNSDILLYGDYEDLLYDNPNIFAYKRTYNNKSIVVVCNFSNQEETFDSSIKDKMKIIFDNFDGASDDNKLAPSEARMYISE